MERSYIKINPSKGVYEMNGMDIGDNKLNRIDISITPDTQNNRIVIDSDSDLNFEAVILDSKCAKPLICQCGHKLSELSADCDVACPECGKHIKVTYGVVGFQ